MRERLNESKAAQIGLLAVLALAVGYLVLSNMGGESSSSSAATESSAAESSEPVSATSAVAAPAGRKLPHEVEAAYERGDTLALLVYRRGGIDDRAVKAATSVLMTMPKVAFFKAPTTKIARFSAITGPVGVSGAPALIVVRGRTHKGDTTAPATVTYGFQGTAEVRQAVIDADYTGPEPSYAPN